MKKDKKGNTSKLSISATKKIAKKRLKGKRLRAFIPALLLAIFLMVPALYSAGMSTHVLNQTIGDLSTIKVESLDDFENTLGMISEMFESVEVDRTAAIVNSAFDLFTFLFSGAIALSLAALGLRIIRNEKPSIATAFKGLGHFFQAFFISIWLAIFTILIGLAVLGLSLAAMGVCLKIRSTISIIAGIAICIILLIFYIYIITRFQLAYFIAADNKQLKARQAIFTSFAMMKKRVWNYFFLDFSFIGWWILVSIPLGLGETAMEYSLLIDNPYYNYAGYVLLALGIIFAALLLSYQTSAEAVYYSTVSGNFKVAAADENSEEEEIFEEEYDEELTPIDESEIPQLENTFDDDEFGSYEQAPEEAAPEEAFEESAPAEDAAAETGASADDGENTVSGSYDMNTDTNGQE